MRVRAEGDAAPRVLRALARSCVRLYPSAAGRPKKDLIIDKSGPLIAPSSHFNFERNARRFRAAEKA